MEETIEIVRKATVPKGDICLSCKYVDIETTPSICAMNGETTGYNTKAVCRFFNESLYESEVVDNRVPCNPRKYYRKCLGCLLHNFSEGEKAFIMLALLGKLKPTEDKKPSTD